MLIWIVALAAVSLTVTVSTIAWAEEAWLANGTVWCSAADGGSSGPMLVMPGDGVVVALGRVEYINGTAYFIGPAVPRFGCMPSGVPVLAEAVESAAREELRFLRGLYEALTAGEGVSAEPVPAERLASTIPGWMRRLDSSGVWGYSGRLPETVAQLIEAVEDGFVYEKPGPDVNVTRVLEDLFAMLDKLLAEKPAAGGEKPGRTALRGSAWPAPGVGVGPGYALGLPGWPPGTLLASTRYTCFELNWAYSLNGSSFTRGEYSLYDGFLDEVYTCPVGAGFLDFDGDGRREVVYGLAYHGFGGWDEELRWRGEDIYIYGDDGRLHGVVGYINPALLHEAAKRLGGKLLSIIQAPGALANRPPRWFFPVSRHAAFVGYWSKENNTMTIYYVEGGKAYPVAAERLPSHRGYSLVPVFQDRRGRYYLVDVLAWRLLVYDPSSRRLVYEERLPGSPPADVWYGGGLYWYPYFAVYPVDLGHDGSLEVVATVSALTASSKRFVPILTLVIGDDGAVEPLDGDGDGYVDALRLLDGPSKPHAAPGVSCTRGEVVYVSRLARRLYDVAAYTAYYAAEKGRLDVLRALASRANLTLFSPTGIVYYNLLLLGGQAFPGEKAVRDYARALVGAAYAEALAELGGFIMASFVDVNSLRWGLRGIPALVAYDVSPSPPAVKRWMETAMPRLLAETPGFRAGFERILGGQNMEEAYVEAETMLHKARAWRETAHTTSGPPATPVETATGEAPPTRSPMETAHPATAAPAAGGPGAQQRASHAGPGAALPYIAAALAIVVIAGAVATRRR